MSSLMASRILIEVETARLAAEFHTQQDLDGLDQLLQQGRMLSPDEVEQLVVYDFTMHQRIAIASGNMMYPLIINSLKNVHTNLAGAFYWAYRGSPVIDQVKVDHTKLVAAIRDRNPDMAGTVMRKLLEDGEDHLLRILPRE
jgi:DNA-binding FadR family transcriptional regulator